MKSPEEMKDELIERFRQQLTDDKMFSHGSTNRDYAATQCAIICVEEKLSLFEQLYQDFAHNNYGKDVIVTELTYWNQVLSLLNNN